MINNGASVNQGDATGKTPLFVAVERGFIDVCKLLIKRGASVNQGDATDKTPLWVAAIKIHYDIWTLLLKNGAEYLYMKKEPFFGELLKNAPVKYKDEYGRIF